MGNFTNLFTKRNARQIAVSLVNEPTALDTLADAIQASAGEFTQTAADARYAPKDTSTLTALTGASSATGDLFYAYDVSTTTLKKMTRAELAVAVDAEGLGGGSLPAWWTVDSTEDEESVDFGGRVRISPTDQSDDPGEGLLVFHTTDDLVNESNRGAVIAALIKPELWGTPGTPDLAVDSFFMLSVLGLSINTPVEEGQAYVEVKARGVEANSALFNSGLQIYPDAGQSSVTVTTITDDRARFNGWMSTRANAAPADGEILNGECAIWFDETNGAAKLMLKGKTADSTVVTAAIALA